MLGGLWPFVAAGFAVYVLWVLARPELVWVGAPVLLLALAAEASSKPWALTAFVVVVVLGSWADVAVRLRAAERQLERALEAAGGVTVPGAGRGRARTAWAASCSCSASSCSGSAC